MASFFRTIDNLLGYIIPANSMPRGPTSTTTNQNRDPRNVHRNVNNHHRQTPINSTSTQRNRYCTRNSTQQQTNLPNNNHNNQQQPNFGQTNMNNISYTSPKETEKVFELKDLRDLCDIDKLTTKQLKTILIRNCVDYKGVIEKEELRAKARILWLDFNSRKETRRAKVSNGSQEDIDDIDDKKLCKICMEREIDSVLLECGHMLSCVNCGKQLSDCPICRQLVTRCVRTFQV